jgi:hypothetical protein
MHSFSVMSLLIYALLSCNHTFKSLRFHFTRVISNAMMMAQVDGTYYGYSKIAISGTE